MKSTDLRAKARAIFGNAIAEPMPKQPNGAKALQQRANARPIPTYKVGGVVKKANGGGMPSNLSPAEREAYMRKMRSEREFRAGRNTPEADDVLITTRRGQRILDEQKKREGEMERKRREKQARADKLLGIPAQKDGGKAGKYANGGILDRVAQAISDIANQDKMKKYGIPKGERPSAPSGSGAQRSGSASGRGNNTPVTVTRREESVTVTPTAPKTQRVKLNEKPKYVKLNEKPKYVKLNAHKSGGKVQTSSDTARKLATEMGGMKKGGKAKDGLAVMIAIGSPKKPVKKATGGLLSPDPKGTMVKHTNKKHQRVGATFANPRGMDTLPFRPGPSAPAPRERVMNPKARAMVEAAADKGAMGAPRTAIGRPIPMPNVAKVQYKDGGSPAKKATGGLLSPGPKGTMVRHTSNKAPRIGATFYNPRGMDTLPFRPEPSAPAPRGRATEPVRRAVGGAGKTRKDMMPVKKAQGGAGKVRKGMMSPEGKILDAIGKARGK